VGLVAEFVDEPLAEEALEHDAKSIHPAYGSSWISLLGEFMDVYFR
jgi:hypothetical protein